MSVDMQSRFRAGAKVCSGAILVLLVIAALGPEKWTPRTALGWQIDHFTRLFCHHITRLPCLVPAVGSRGAPDGRRIPAGRSASFDTGSVSQSCGRIMRLRRGASGGAPC